MGAGLSNSPVVHAAHLCGVSFLTEAGMAGNTLTRWAR